MDRRLPAMIAFGVALLGCGMAPEAGPDGAPEGGALVEGGAFAAPAPESARGRRARSLPSVAARLVAVPLPEAGALPSFAALLQRYPRSLTAHAPDGAYLLLDPRGRLHRVGTDGRSSVRRLGGGAARADGFAVTDRALVWYRSVRPRSREGMAFYFIDLELHRSEDGGLSWRKQLARLTVGNVGYLLQIDRDGNLRLWTGAEFRCGGGAYTRYQGRIDQDPEAWVRDDGLSGAESFPPGPLLPRRR